MILIKTLVFCFISPMVFAQVGIGTTTPRGALDVASSTHGLVYPRVVLTATDVQAPVVNPDGGSLAAGTVVYNTAMTQNGSNDVYPGIYVWDGSLWVSHFIKKDFEKFEQTGGCQRTTIRETYSDPNPNDVDNVAGLTNRTFTPKYTGTYRVEVRTNFGGGAIADFTSDDAISLATTEGAFFLTMSGAGVDIDPTSAVYDYQEGWIYTHVYSTHNSIESPALEDNENIHYASLVLYVDLTGGTDYTFNLSNCMYTGDDYLVNNGDSGDGRGHIGHTIPCSVEFTFVEE